MIKDNWQTNSSLWLNQEFSLRKARHSRYSLRRFARQLEIAPGRLSELLTGKRRITLRQGRKISEKLKMEPHQRELLFDVLEKERTLRRNRARLKLLSHHTATPETSQIDENTLRVIAGWQHLAILSLLQISGFRWSAKWVGGRLGISEEEARSYMKRLKKLKLVEKTPQGWKRTARPIRTSSDVPSLALRQAHREHLALACRALDQVPVEQRDITGITMAIDPQKIPQAKKLIRNFRHALAEILEQDEKKEVFHLNISLFPLSIFSEKEPL